jgi:MFS family permease
VRLFRIPTISITQAQSFLVGVIYYGNIFYVPMFFQYVKGYSAIKSGALVLAYTLPQSVWGIISGQIISRTNRYKAVIIFGSGIWALGAGLQILWTPDTSLGVLIGILEVSSIGVGCCLQSSKYIAIKNASQLRCYGSSCSNDGCCS